MTARIRMPKASLPFPLQPWVAPSLVAQARTLDPPALAPGTLIAAFEVPGDAVPWRAPIHSKTCSGGITPKHCRAWKQKVALAAHQAGYGEANGVPAYQGFARVVFWFCRKAPAGKSKWAGRRWGSVPDWDNLAKGLADAVSGNVFRQPQPMRDEDGLPVLKDNGKPKMIPTNHQAPAPTGRIIADDKRVTSAAVEKIYWSRSLAYLAVYAQDDRHPGPFPFAP